MPISTEHCTQATCTAQWSSAPAPTISPPLSMFHVAVLSSLGSLTHLALTKPLGSPTQMTCPNFMPDYPTCPTSKGHWRYKTSKEAHAHVGSRPLLCSAGCKASVEHQCDTERAHNLLRNLYLQQSAIVLAGEHGFLGRLYFTGAT